MTSRKGPCLPLLLLLAGVPGVALAQEPPAPLAPPPLDSSTDAEPELPPVAPVSELVPEPVPEPATPEEPERVEPREEESTPTRSAPEAPAAKESVLEKPSPRQGHYIAFGLHGVTAFANDRDRGRRGPGVGLGYGLRVGERITDWLDLGLSIGYATIGGDDPWSLGHFGVHAQVYPVEHWFVHAGFGFGAGGGDDPEDPDFSRGRFGDVYRTGVGRNIYLSDRKTSGGWLLTPVLTAEYGRDKVFPTSSFSVGVEISHWWGTSRNQLDLDFDEAYKPRK